MSDGLSLPNKKDSPDFIWNSGKNYGFFTEF